MTMAFPKPEKALRAPKLRGAARGKSCTLRLNGCLPGTETVVLAHLRGTWCGVGQKPDDWFGVYACQHCHDVIDGRARGEWTDADKLRALYETLRSAFSEGLICL